MTIAAPCAAPMLRFGDDGNGSNDGFLHDLSGRGRMVLCVNCGESMPKGDGLSYEGKNVDRTPGHTGQ